MSSVAEATGHRGLAICANGAYVYDLHSDEIVREHLLEPAAARELVSRLRAALPELSFAVERGREFAHEPGYRPRLPTPDATLVTAVEALVEAPVAKLLARHEGLDADALLARARTVVGELATLTHSSREGLLEVSAAGISKASTLEALCVEHGFAAADVVAFGDMPNDLPMLAWAGHPVAVANAHPDVLAAVQEHTLSNDEDGVAVTLERLYGAGQR
jgi:hydroxymethylpyrimidine pyrophosphatase-like HAD family hydrolase